ncbi:hypothetical protein GYMLUDRAFT_49420 [Collybiopsis luxurians FD-317 M1]|uniref:Uncharacterized protein n=1 Tax=Collybiopsis luxurians FD-317 M1 TaxID=944289 RepID=A0A0D0CE45_9AGAR|nr:hypothetical protein GYMLUDRAFT_49420 [Collybiopsis luxurians FD-317 M1]
MTLTTNESPGLGDHGQQGISSFERDHVYRPVCEEMGLADQDVQDPEHEDDDDPPNKPGGAQKKKANPRLGSNS